MLATLGFWQENPNLNNFLLSDYKAIRSKLIFNHGIEDNNNNKRKYQEAEKALTSLCRKSVDDIRKEVPHLFNQYVYTLKQLRHPELEAIYTRSTEICKFNRKAE